MGLLGESSGMGEEVRVLRKGEEGKGERENSKVEGKGEEGRKAFLTGIDQVLFCVALAFLGKKET